MRLSPGLMAHATRALFPKAMPRAMGVSARRTATSSKDSGIRRTGPGPMGIPQKNRKIIGFFIKSLFGYFWVIFMEICGQFPNWRWHCPASRGTCQIQMWQVPKTSVFMISGFLGPHVNPYQIAFKIPRKPEHLLEVVFLKICNLDI